LVGSHTALVDGIVEFQGYVLLLTVTIRDPRNNGEKSCTASSTH
jgi:hypothetical protein